MRKVIRVLAMGGFLVLVLLIYGQVTPTEEWIAIYNGPGNGDDYAQAIVANPEGNVYVTGYSDGNGTAYDYATLKYDRNGNQLWIMRYNGPGGGDDYAYNMVVDPAGNVYVTGYSDEDGTSYSIATVKYDKNGNEVWDARYAGLEVEGFMEFLRCDVALGPSGNVYVTGTISSGTNADYATIKYDRDGVLVWASMYRGPTDSFDLAHAITVDPSGNVYVTGGSLKGEGTMDLDYATVKYDKDGAQLWAARYDYPGNYVDYANGGIVVDPRGNVYVTGFSNTEDSDAYADYATVKYDRDGNQLWVMRYDGPYGYSDEAHAIAVSHGGDVYVTGGSLVSGIFGNGTPRDKDYATIKYDRDGNQIWVSRYNSPANRYEAAYAIALDPSGNIYVTGGGTSKVGRIQDPTMPQ